ncbi:hypothetical protein WJX81_004610 [Elliptochloris bilobata]|uniref:Uncharacterized protein n=1 Tax=Elliptochloris bilobata TaxID=381761 RepID=A0AAW1QIQ5_9CHLO
MAFRAVCGPQPLLAVDHGLACFTRHSSSPVTGRSSRSFRRLPAESFHHKARRARAAAGEEGSQQPQVVQAQAGSAPEGASVADDPGAQMRFLSAWYPFVAAALAALAAAQLTLPQQFLRRALVAPAGALGPALAQLGGALGLLPCAALYVLTDAAKHDRLASATYRRLNLGVIAYFALLMAAVAAAPQTALDRWYRGLLIALAPFAFSAAGAAWVTTAESRQPLPLLREAVAGALANARNLIDPANAVSAAYSVATAAAVVIGVPLLGLGGGAPAGTAGDLFLRRCLAAALLFEAVVLYSLKDAADRGRLGARAELAGAFGKLLVANRGEIACRVLATARLLGVPTVAVYSEADRDAVHVSMANEAVCIGPARAQDSYLRGDRILEAAHRMGARAIHPGYGFLSENAGFAAACEAAGVVFVGPPAAAIAAMGNKSEAKALMSEAGVPVVPGYHGQDQSMSRLTEEGRNVGFPLLVKAVLGGGGKGMKLAQAPEELEDALASARREAAAAFGDERVLLERFIERPRHIEVQVFADAHGNAVHLYERDCSVQRRHQKVMEEAPAPGIDPGFRASIGGAAVAAARAVGYRNAGTVEFIMDTDTGDYYFMEMNTRLQVEHPVTEAVTGVDLVEWQLRVAAGQQLPLQQEQLQLSGHAFEARLYAESPERGFLPSPGTLLRWRTPPGAAEFCWDADVRIDSGVHEGDAVGGHYDPMIAKVLARGTDRDSALAALHGVLTDLEVGGLSTNQAFLRRLATHPAFVAAELDTAFITRHGAELTAVPDLAPEVAALAALAAHALRVHAASEAAVSATSGRLTAWDIPDSLRLGYEYAADVVLRRALCGTPLSARLTFARDGSVWIQGSGGACFDGTGGASFDVTARHIAVGVEGGALTAELDGRQFAAALESYMHGDEQVLEMWVGGEAHEFRAPVPCVWAREGAAAAATGIVSTPMPGRIIKVLVDDGAEVDVGTPLVVLEAMKMEHAVRAPCAGTVTELAALAGAQVDDGHILAVVVPPDADNAAAAA